MTVLSILETLFIGPLKLIFEFIFEYANRFVGHPGLAIIFLSLIMNILVLPLYRRADAMQEEARDIELKLHDGAAHIKKTFSGDERMMVLQTYYRQNNYKPTDALRGSVSLLLEIPFFIAAYQFLSHLEILKGVPFGPITDLGSPDGLIVIGGFVINLLPIIMTTVNLISSALFLKGFPLKTKIQLYAMALFFFVFLYSSPACLVFYWTLNNVFSLVKTIFYKLKNPQKVLRILTAVIGLALIFFGGFIYDSDSLRRKIFLIAVGAFLLLPLLTQVFKKAVHIKRSAVEAVPNRRAFIVGSVFLTVLVGILIPSVFIGASPQEYVDIIYFHNPLWYIVRSFCMAAGTFLIWMRVFYWLASPKGKVVFEKLVFIMCGGMLVNYMFFGTDLGTISSLLQYDNGMAFSPRQVILNLVIIAALSAFLYFFARIWKRAVSAVLAVCIIALGGMSALNIINIKKSVDQIYIQTRAEEDMPGFRLSKNGRNVIVLMLDRAMGEYVPYIFNEKPELKEKFSGFTYYSNTISFGGYTNFGVPSLLGGYEYTPVEMNKRNSESMVSKHNEALKVMPVIFSENDYEVTVCDPVYAGYHWIPDLSIYDDYPDISAYITKGRFGDVRQKIANIDNTNRNFFCFSIMKTMPLFIQPYIYDGGLYHKADPISSEDVVYSAQTRTGLSVSTGMTSLFMEPYHVLENLPNITDITNDETDTFLFLSNDLTHEPMLLKEPDYLPEQNVDNTEYDAENTDRFIVDGRELKMNSDDQMIHYQTNMAAMIKLGEWFDYMRKNGVYDNTKIILAADHGRNLAQLDELILDDGSDGLKNVELYYPLLMVKDFNSTGFTVSDEFMTNADVPALAMKDLIDNPVNPFTGKEINSDEKYAHDQYIIMTHNWRVDAEGCGNTYPAAAWASVRDNIWDKNNWKFFDQSTILDEYAAPHN